MYTLPTEPKSIGGVLDDIFRLFRVAFGPTFVLALIGAIVGVAPSVYTTLTFGNDPNAALAIFSDPGYYVFLVVGFLVGIIVQLAMFDRIHAAATHRESSVAQSLSKGGRLALRGFVAGILFGLALFVGLILLIIPGIFLGLALAFYSVLIVVEDARITQSLEGSFRLVKGNWWRTFTIFLVIGIVVMVLFVVVGIVAGIIGAFSGDYVTTIIVTQAISLVAYVVLYPLLYAAMLGVYYDLKLRTEGGDLASRVESLSKA